jgi:hypothetical protein
MSATSRALVILAVLSTCAYPQSAPHLSSRTLEIGAFGGFTVGVNTRGYTVGGNISAGINRFILPYFEYGRYVLPLPTERTGILGVTGESFTIRYETGSSDIHAGVHVRVPIRESRLVPYLVFGAGTIRRSGSQFTVRLAGPDGLGGEITAPTPAVNEFAINYGGGLRYYLNQRLGFRIESKWYNVTGANKITENFGKLAFGVFLQLR